MLALPVSRADVLTYHYNNQLTGLNPGETGLNPASVSVGFKQAWTSPVDGDVYAQPLYISSIVIKGARHNVLIVATENDSVYALDADTGSVLWQTPLIPSGEGLVPSTCGDLPVPMGITSTPVIDPVNNKVFAVAYTRNKTSGHKIYRLHSLNLLTGADTASPEIAATFPGTVPAVDTTGIPPNQVVHFNAAEERQRSALLLFNGIIYVAFASFCDSPPYTGWILGFDENSLALVGTLDTNPTAAGGSTFPDGSGGGVWGAGGALSAGARLLFAVTGNGPWDGKATFGDSILRLTPQTLSVSDYFTPFDQAKDQQSDLDLGSGGPVLPNVKDNAGVTHFLLVLAGKDKRIYVADRNNLGKQTLNPPNSGIYQVIGPPQTPIPLPQEVFGPGAFLNGAMYWVPRGLTTGNPVEKFVFSNAKLGTTPAAISNDNHGHTILFFLQGMVPATTAFVNSAGIVSAGLVWVSGYSSTSGATILYAFDPDTLAALFSSGTLTVTVANVPMPVPIPGTKFNEPTIANSKVYIGTAGTTAKTTTGKLIPVPAQVFAFAGTATAANIAVDMTKNPSVQLMLGPIVQGTGGAYSQVVTVKNIGTTPLFTTPLSLVLDGLSLNATLSNASGATTYTPLSAPLFSPYLNFTLSAPLPPGNTTSLTLQFFNSSTAPITYTARLLDGLGFR